MNKDVKYNVALGNSEVEDLIGYAVKDGDKIFFTYIRSKTTGYIPNRVKRITERKCISFIWGLIKFCYDFPASTPNPLTPKEIETVKNALSYINLETIQKKISTISESQTLLGSQGAIYSPSKNCVAYMSEDGLILIKKSNQIIKRIGMQSSTQNKPYNLQIKENGNMFIINKSNDKIWTTETGSKGVPPFKLELSEDGKLTLKDSKNKILWTK